jgi:hypothetical protein
VELKNWWIAIVIPKPVMSTKETSQLYNKLKRSRENRTFTCKKFRDPSFLGVTLQKGCWLINILFSNHEENRCYSYCAKLHVCCFIIQ